MKKKILFLVATLLLSLSVAETVTAQSAGQGKSYVTSSMARKITYFCQYKDLAMAIFADANEIVSGVELDKTINTLDKHLDCAENFFLAIYYRYGMEMGYGVLKNMGLTPREIEVVQAEWKKDDERTAVIAEQKRKEKERGYLKLIEGNGIFTTEQLFVQPEINIDLTSISWLLSDNPKSEPVNYWFHCIVNKDGYIYLQDESDTLRYTDTEKAIYNNYIKGYNAFVLGKVEIDGKQVPVNCNVLIEIEEVRKQHKYNYDEILKFNIQKEKRLNFWYVLWDKSNYNQRNLRCKDFQGLKSQLTGALNNCHEIKGLKDTHNIEVEVYERTLQCNFSEEVILPHIFEINLNEYGVKTKLNYQTCFISENAFEKQDEAYIQLCNKMEKKYQKHPERFNDVSLYDGDFPYYISDDGFGYNFASEAYNISLLEKEGVYMLFNEQKFVKRK